jgi:bleomycin hydrolase
MKRSFLVLVLSATAIASFAQTDVSPAAGIDVKSNFTVIKKNAATPVKNQAATGTCWSFSTTSLVESQSIKNNLGEFDLSEMFTVRNIYIEKARNYVLRQGHAQFSEGALGHDQIRAIAKYGAMPESVYSGLTGGKTSHDHKKLSTQLKQYLDDLIKKTPLPENWMAGFVNILDEALGKPPAKFEFRGKSYTAESFAKNVLQFNANDYVSVTSFTHHPFYEPFILEVPDNYSNGAYLNIPLDELIQLTKDALNSGYTLLWDADVSNMGFMQDKGVAGLYDTSINAMKKMDMRKLRSESIEREKSAGGDDAMAAKRQSRTGAENNERTNERTAYQNGTKEEVLWDAELRQALFENLTTQDDHLMHIIGLEKSKAGKDYFIVKNSWGKIGPDEGYIHVSESYFAINTISLIVPKAAISKALLEKLKLK